MIPRVAYWYWTGKPLPWLRAQSMATFARHHPDWKLVLGSPDLEEAPPGVELERDTVTDPNLPPAARSDVWRYYVLQRGGVYSDTDVLFLGSVEPLLDGEHDAWLTQDGGTVWPKSRGRIVLAGGKKVYRQDGLSIGFMAASEGSQFFRRTAELAQRTPPGPDYQSHGAPLLVRHWADLTRGLSVGPIPFSALYGGSSAHEVRQVWTKPGPVHGGRIGVHWYGGSAESARFLLAKSAEELPDCAVRRSLMS